MGSGLSQEAPLCDISHWSIRKKNLASLLSPIFPTKRPSAWRIRSSMLVPDRCMPITITGLWRQFIIKCASLCVIQLELCDYGFQFAELECGALPIHGAEPEAAKASKAIRCRGRQDSPADEFASISLFIMKPSLLSDMSQAQLVHGSSLLPHSPYPHPKTCQCSQSFVAETA